MDSNTLLTLLSVLISFSTLAFEVGRMYEKLSNESLKKRNKRKK